MNLSSRVLVVHIHRCYRATVGHLVRVHCRFPVFTFTSDGGDGTSEARRRRWRSWPSSWNATKVHGRTRADHDRQTRERGKTLGARTHHIHTHTQSIRRYSRLHATASLVVAYASCTPLSRGCVEEEKDEAREGAAAASCPPHCHQVDDKRYADMIPGEGTHLKWSRRGPRSASPSDIISTTNLFGGGGGAQPSREHSGETRPRTLSVLRCCHWVVSARAQKHGRACVCAEKKINK